MQLLYLVAGIAYLSRNLRVNHELLMHQISLNVLLRIVFSLLLNPEKLQMAHILKPYDKTTK